MNGKDHAGVSQAILTEFVEHELPLLERTHREVEAGQVLSPGEIEMLGVRLGELQEWYSVAYQFPEHKHLLAQAIEMIDQITTRAVENARQQAGQQPPV
ncbi:hypothetical protein [Haliea sp. E17]|uniref:hypothetical protein n=1 Tax=Haliea sp. E17 TaxID=3401576 RepID=UPI003AAD7152